MRMPFSGWFLMNSLRMICRTFIDWFAQSMRFLPISASSMFLTSASERVVVVCRHSLSCDFRCIVCNVTAS